MEIRPFLPGDAEACLAIFDSNTPPFFLPQEREEFAEYLAEDLDDYFVGEEAGRIVACGGFATMPQGETAYLTWGMVQRGAHGQGRGWQLLQFRLAALRGMGEPRQVKIETSPLAAPFFARAGFVVDRLEQDGFGPGLDRVEMTLALRPSKAPEGLQG